MTRLKTLFMIEWTEYDTIQVLCERLGYKLRNKQSLEGYVLINSEKEVIAQTESNDPVELRKMIIKNIYK